MDLTQIVKDNSDKFDGISEETINKLSESFKASGYTLLASSEKEPYIPKSRLDDVIAQRDSLKTQASETAGQLESLRKAAKNDESLTAKIQELQGKLKAGDDKIKTLTIESAVRVSAAKSKAKDPADLTKFLDLSKASITSDGTVAGIDDQIEGLKKSKPYLFEAEPKLNATTGDATAKGNPPATNQFNDFVRSAAFGGSNL